MNEACVSTGILFVKVEFDALKIYSIFGGDANRSENYNGQTVDRQCHLPCLLIAFFVFLMRNISKNHLIPKLFPYILNAVIGYLIGSFPTAYLLVMWKAHLDIRSIGGGNVGTRNTLDITGSKLLGFIVLLIDIVKGAFAVWFSTLWLGQNFWVMSAAGIAAIVGHNYSVWIQLKGGRGLATSVGVFLLLGWIFIALWCVSWLALYLGLKNIHIANVFATIISAVAVLFIPEQLLNITLPTYTTVASFRCAVSIVSILILLRHIQPIIEIFKLNTKSLSKS